MKIDEFVLIPKSDLQHRLANLKADLQTSEDQGDIIRSGIELHEIKILEQIISLSLDAKKYFEITYEVGTKHKEYSLTFDDPKGRFFNTQIQNWIDNT